MLGMIMNLALYRRLWFKETCGCHICQWGIVMIHCVTWSNTHLNWLSKVLGRIVTRMVWKKCKDWLLCFLRRSPSSPLPSRSSGLRAEPSTFNVLPSSPDTDLPGHSSELQAFTSSLRFPVYWQKFLEPSTPDCVVYHCKTNCKFLSIVIPGVFI